MRKGLGTNERHKTDATNFYLCMSRLKQNKTIHVVGCPPKAANGIKRGGNTANDRLAGAHTQEWRKIYTVYCSRDSPEAEESAHAQQRFRTTKSGE